MELFKALLPTIGVMIIFWIGMRALLQADRRERAAQARFEAMQDKQAVQDEAAAPEGQAGPDRR